MNRQDWSRRLMEALEKSGEPGRETAGYIRTHRVKIDFRRQNPATGAYWTIFRRIHINPGHASFLTDPTHAGLLSLIVHEVRHLQQGFFTALSIYGELDAWQAGYEFYRSLMGKYPHPLVEQICALPLGWRRDVLRKARHLMLAHAGKKYRADLLPLYPLHREAWFRLTGGPKSIHKN